MFGPLFGVQMSFCVAGARDCAPCQKWTKREGFVAFPKRMAGVGHLKRICKDAFSVTRAVQETCSSELLGCILEHQIFSFGKMIWQVQHFVWPGITFSWQAQYFRQVEWKKSQNTLVRGRQLCTQLSIFERSLAELFRFWCCQLRKLKMSCRIASFWMVSSTKIEEVSQNCFVLDVVKFKNWGSVAKSLRFQAWR